MNLNAELLGQFETQVKWMCKKMNITSKEELEECRSLLVVVLSGSLTQYAKEQKIEL